MKRKIFGAVCLVLLLALSASGCGKKNNVKIEQVESLTQVVSELKSFDEEEQKGIFGIFKKGSNKIEAMKAKYAKAENNVNQIVTVLEDHQVTLLKDVAMMDKLYDLNKTYFKELSMYILAGKKKLQQYYAYCTAEGRCRSLGCVASFTGNSPTWCIKRQALNKSNKD